jgi:PleD family two-component response regulator
MGPIGAPGPQSTNHTRSGAGDEEARVEPVSVLIVDDDASIRVLFEIALSVEEGIGEVRVAANGRDAIHVCKDFEPDVVVLDYQMPVMDGRTAAAYIRDVCPTASIVAFSGVIDDKPPWADHYWAKGDLPNLKDLCTFAEL